MLRATSVMWGGRIRRASTFLAVPASATVDHRRETAAQREFERLIENARRQKKRQVQSAIKSALKKQARIGHDLTARQRRYAANKVKATKELQRISAEREQRMRQQAQEAEKAARATSTVPTASGKRTSTPHARSGKKASSRSHSPEALRKRKEEERLAESFFNTLAELQRRRKDQIAKAIKDALQHAKAAAAPPAAAPEAAEPPASQSLEDVEEVPLIASTAKRSSSPPSKKPPTRHRRAVATVDAEMAVVQNRGRDAKKKISDAPIEEKADPIASEATSTIADDTLDAVREEKEEEGPTAPVQPTKRQTSSAARKKKSAEPAAPSQSEASDDGEPLGAPYFEEVRKRIDSKLLPPHTTEPTTRTAPAAAAADTGNWPTPESNTGLFRL